LSVGDVTGVTEGEPGTYNKSKIKTIFGDKKFQNWQKKCGPHKVNIFGCQIGIELESTFLNLIKNPSSKQKAVGLGQGCLLDLSAIILQTPEGNDINNRKDWDALEAGVQEGLLQDLQDKNDEYGYGILSEKVKNDKLLDYYFDVVPKGAWPTVDVRAPDGTKFSFIHRTGKYSAKFNKKCSRGIGLRPRQVNVPEIP
jgi:hypothetical protein